jgi:drug/metabolite transporter (DMT)-like permease
VASRDDHEGPAAVRDGAGAPGALGIACIIGATITFTTQDMTIKWLSGDYPLHQIVFTRALVAIILTLAILVPLEGGLHILRTKQLKLHLFRGLAVVVANMTFFTGLAAIPLGEATAIFFIAPLFITMLSVPVLGERVGIQRWLAVVIGLIGVAVMLRPGSDGFQLAFLLPLAAAFAYALLQISTRKLGIAESAVTMAFFIQLTFVVVSGAIGLAFGDGAWSGTGDPSLEFLLRAWVWPAPRDAMIMLGIGVLSAMGGYLISQGYRLTEAGLAAPFEYLALPLAVFWSVMIWGDWPDALSWLGIALIVGAGLFVFYRETVRGGQLKLRRRPLRLK